MAWEEPAGNEVGACPSEPWMLALDRELPQTA